MHRSLSAVVAAFPPDDEWMNEWSLLFIAEQEMHRSLAAAAAASPPDG